MWDSEAAVGVVREKRKEVRALRWWWSCVCFAGTWSWGRGEMFVFPWVAELLFPMWELQDIVCSLPTPTLPPVHKILMPTHFRSCNWEPLSLRNFSELTGLLRGKMSKHDVTFWSLYWDVRLGKSERRRAFYWLAFIWYAPMRHGTGLSQPRRHWFPANCESQNQQFTSTSYNSFPFCVTINHISVVYYP